MIDSYTNTNVSGPEVSNWEKSATLAFYFTFAMGVYGSCLFLCKPQANDSWAHEAFPVDFHGDPFL